MAKAKLEVCIIDIDKVEKLRDLINELLDIIEQYDDVLNDADKSFALYETRQLRKKYIDRFCDIVTG